MFQKSPASPLEPFAVRELFLGVGSRMEDAELELGVIRGAERVALEGAELELGVPRGLWLGWAMNYRSKFAMARGGRVA